MGTISDLPVENHRKSMKSLYRQWTSKSFHWRMNMKYSNRKDHCFMGNSACVAKKPVVRCKNRMSRGKLPCGSRGKSYLFMNSQHFFHGEFIDWIELPATFQNNCRWVKNGKTCKCDPDHPSATRFFDLRIFVFLSFGPLNSILETP